jgi:hypothetical protein
MIERRDVERLIIKTSRSFAGNKERLSWWEEWRHSKHPHDYSLAEIFVRHLIVQSARGRRQEFPAAFQLIEQMLLDGDGYVRELAIHGFLEGLQNSDRASDFVPYLLPASKWWWEELELFWDGEVDPFGSSGRPKPAELSRTTRP